MNELMNGRNGFGAIASYKDSTGTFGLMSDILSAIPSALAKPILDYQRTKAQRELCAIAIAARRRERAEILRTMQILAKYGQLTPELSQQLMVAYHQPALPGY